MLRKLIPGRVKKEIRRRITRHKANQIMALHNKLLVDVRKKKKIKVAFLLFNQSIWKYEKLYFLLKSDKRFEPVVFICPFITYGEEVMEAEMNRSFLKFKEKGYEVRKTKINDKEWIDVKTEYQPDLVFFTTPWQHTLQQYTIGHFLNVLTCYVPYGFNSSHLHQVHFNYDMQNFCWKVFCETSYHKKLAQEYSAIKGRNFVVTGYPGIDNLIDKQYNKKEVWKPQEKSKKRIIWAPHHSIPTQSNLLDYSTFLTYSEKMLELAINYQDKIQICFKPHPNLKGKLSNPKVWGKEKTETYYQCWENLINGQLAEGDYIDLFLGSDALIHDSASFLIEYLYVDKPVLFLIDNTQVKTQFNDLGKKVLGNINLGYKNDDIVQFVEDVIQGNDEFKDKRMKLVNKELAVPNGGFASNNIYNYLIKQLT